MPQNILSLDYDPFTGPRRKKRREPLSSTLKNQALSRAGGRCEKCRESFARGIKPHFHHKDGKPSHNTLSNIEVLCPNCHSTGHRYVKKTKRDYFGNVVSERRVLKAHSVVKRKKVKKKKKRQSRETNPWGFNPPRFTPPKFVPPYGV